MDQEMVLGIDAGTSGVKVAIFTRSGRRVASAFQEVNLASPRPGWSELSWDEVRTALVQTIQEVMQAAPKAAGALVGIGVSATCPSPCMVDARGQALSPVLTFHDARASVELEAIRGSIGPQGFFERTGNHLAQSTCSASVFRWFRRHYSKEWRDARWLVHLSTVIGHFLTGNWGMDPSNASFTGLFSVPADQLAWSAYMVEALACDRTKLPPLLEAGGRLGHVTAEAARATGLPRGVPVAMGAADTACSALAVGIVDGGQVFESTGTSGVITVALSRPTFDPRFLNRRHVIRGRWLSHGAMSSAGASLRWLRDNVLLPPARDVMEDPLVQLRQSYEWMDEEASQAEPGAAGLLFLPYMLGERSPVWDREARGALVGLSLFTSRAELIRSVMEGVAFGLRQLLDLARTELGVNCSEILSVGGGARSQVWTQVKADILGVPIRRAQVHDAAALGAALLGGVAAGLWRSESEIPRKLALELDQEMIYPCGERTRLYDQLFETYVSLYPSLRDVFGSIASVRQQLA